MRATLVTNVKSHPRKSRIPNTDFKPGHKNTTPCAVNSKLRQVVAAAAVVVCLSVCLFIVSKRKQICSTNNENVGFSLSSGKYVTAPKE